MFAVFVSVGAAHAHSRQTSEIFTFGLYHRRIIFIKFVVGINCTMDYILKGSIVLLLCGVFGDPEEVKPVSVYVGDSVTLQTGAKIQSSDKILWRFGEEGSANLLVQMHGNRISYKDSIDERIKDRLLISNIGDLTINNMRIKYSGLYTAEIQTGSGSSFKKFRVTVNESPRYTDAGASVVKSVSVMEGESVTLPSDEQTQKGDLILWRFGDKNLLIAQGDMEDNKISYDDDDDGRFSGRLKLNDQTGDLTITKIRTSNTGVYNLKIISNRETKYKTFTVSVSGAGLSSGAIAGIVISCICIYLLATGITAGVFLYHRKKISDTIVSVNEGNPVTLSGDYRELQIGDKMKWKFNNRVIINGEKTEDTKIRVTYSEDQQFKDRLKLGSQVAYLTIKDASKKDTGLYEGKITHNKQTSRFKFNVYVIDGTLLPDELVSAINELAAEDPLFYEAIDSQHHE